MLHCSCSVFYGGLYECAVFYNCTAVYSVLQCVVPCALHVCNVLHCCVVFCVVFTSLLWLQCVYSVLQWPATAAGAGGLCSPGLTSRPSGQCLGCPELAKWPILCATLSAGNHNFWAHIDQAFHVYGVRHKYGPNNIRGSGRVQSEVR